MRSASRLWPRAWRPMPRPRRSAPWAAISPRASSMGGRCRPSGWPGPRSRPSEVDHTGGVAPPRVIALFGPTGIGKTAVAVALAERLREMGEDPVAVSADALQVYQGLETLTGVASRAEQARLEHRLISFIPVDASFSAGQYAELAHAELDALVAAGRLAIVVGGTGLYLRAALTDLSLKPPPAARRAWRRRSPPAIASGSCARSSCSTRASSTPPARRRAASRSCGPTRCACPPCSSAW